MSDGFMEPSEPSPPQKRLLNAVASRWADMDRDWVARVRVSAMDDGQMGSLELHFLDHPDRARIMGSKVAELQFKDSDGVDVIVSLIVDPQMLPLELEVWKVDFSPLLTVPDSL